jgi:hypothetical protein
VKNKNYSPIYAIFFALLLKADTSFVSKTGKGVGVRAAPASGVIHLERKY